MKRKLAISISIIAVIILICLSACVKIPETPTINVNHEAGTITITKVEGAEYSIKGGDDPQDSNVFTGLAPAVYQVTGRIKAVGKTPASAWATPIAVTIKGPQSAFTIGAIPDKKIGDAAFQISTSGGAGGTLVYSIVSGPASVSSSGLVTLSGTAVGTVTVKVVSPETSTSLAATAQTSFYVGKGTPATFTINEVTGLKVGDTAKLVLSNGVTNGITYSITDGTQFATVDAAGNVRATGAGTILVKAVMAETATHIGLESAQRSITIGKAAGSIAISAIPTLQINTPAQIVVTGLGTGALTYALSGNDSDAATVANGQITFNRSATVTLTVTRAGDANYESASASVSVTASTVFQFKAYEGDIRLYDDITLETLGGNGKGAVSLSIKSGYTSVAEVLLNGKIRIKAPSSFIVVATKAAEGGHAAQTIEKEFIAKRALQAAISVPTVPDIKYNTPFDLNVTGGSVNGSAISYEILKDANYNNARIDANGKIVATSMSAFTVTVTKAGDTFYEDATCTYNITSDMIKRASVTLGITTTLIDPIFGSTHNLTGANAVVKVTGDVDINKITFSVVDVLGTGVASINQTTKVLTINKVGTFKIVATIAADANYEASSASTGEINSVPAVQAPLTYTINKSDIAIGDVFTITVYGGSGTGALSITDMTGGQTNFTITSEGNVFTLTAKVPGEFVLAIKKASDGNYEDAETIAPVIVTKERQLPITITPVGPFTFVAAPNNVKFDVKATQDGKTLSGTITYSIVDGNPIAQVDGTGKVTIYGAGTFKVRVTKAGYTTAAPDPVHDYRNESAEYTVVVNKANQTALNIVATGSNGPVTGNVIYGDEFNLNSTGGSTNNIVKYTVSGSSGIASIGTGNVVKVNGVGGFTIIATKQGDANYLDAVTSLALVSVAAENTATFEGPFTFKYKDAQHEIKLKDNKSNGRITYTFNQTSSAGSLSVTTGGFLQFNGVGTITVTAHINADDNGYYAQKSISQVYTVGKADQTGFVFTSYPTTAEFDTTFNVVAAGGNTQGKVTYASNNPAVGQLTDVNLPEVGEFKVFTGDGASLFITAKKLGNEFYNDVYATVQIQLTNKTQSAPVIEIYNYTLGAMYNPLTGANAIRYGDQVSVRVYGNDFVVADSTFSVNLIDGSQNRLGPITKYTGAWVPDKTGYTGKMSGLATTTGIGTANIVITLFGDYRFQSLTLTCAVNIVANNSAFTLTTSSFLTETYGGERNISTAIANVANREVVFELKNSNDVRYVSISNDGKNLLYVGATSGDIVIRAKRVANGFYTEAVADITLRIAKADQKIVVATSVSTAANPLNVKVGDKFTLVISSDPLYKVSMWSGSAPNTVASGTTTTVAFDKGEFTAKAVGTSEITFKIAGNDNLNELVVSAGSGYVINVGKADQAALKIKQDGKDVAGTFANPIKVKYGTTIAFTKDNLGAGFTSIYAEGGNGSGAVTYTAGQAKKVDGGPAADGLALARLGWNDTVNTYQVFAVKSSALGLFQITMVKAGGVDYNDKTQVVYVEVVTGDAPTLQTITQAVQAGYGATLDKAFYEGKTLFVSSDVIGYGDVTTNVVTDPENVIADSKIVGVSSQNIYATVTVTKSGTYKHPGAPAAETTKYKFYEDATSKSFSIRAIKGTMTLKGEFEKQDNYYVGIPYRFTVTGSGTGAITVTSSAADTYDIKKVEGSANLFDITVKKYVAADAAPLTVNQASDANFNGSVATVNNPEFKKNNYIDFMELTLKGSDGSEVTYSPTSFDASSILTLRYGVKYTYTIVGREEFGSYDITSAEVAGADEGNAAAFVANDTQLYLETLYYNKAGVTGSFSIAQLGNLGFNAGSSYRFDYKIAQGPQAPVYLTTSNQSDFVYQSTGTPRIMFTTDPKADNIDKALLNPINDSNIFAGRTSSSYTVTILDPDGVLVGGNYVYGSVNFGINECHRIEFVPGFAKPGSFTVKVTFPAMTGYYDELVITYVVNVGKAEQGAISTTLLHATNEANGAYVYGSGSAFNINALVQQADPKTANALTFAVAEEYQHILQLNANGTFRVIGAGLVDKDGNPIPAIITVTRPGDATYADKVFNLEINAKMGSQTIGFSNSDAVQTLVFKEFYTPAELLDLSLARGGILMTVSNVSKANIAYPNNTGAGNNLFLYGIGEFDVSFQAAEVKNPTDGYYSASNIITKRFKVVAADQPEMTINNALIGGSINVQYTLQVVQAATLANSPVIWTVQKKVGDNFVAATPAQATVTSSTVTILEAGVYKIIATREGKVLANPKYDSTEIYYNTATASGEYTFA